jgi:hypothetical protein
MSNDRGRRWVRACECVCVCVCVRVCVVMQRCSLSVTGSVCRVSNDSFLPGRRPRDVRCAACGVGGRASNKKDMVFVSAMEMACTAPNGHRTNASHRTFAKTDAMHGVKMGSAVLCPNTSRSADDQVAAGH